MRLLNKFRNLKYKGGETLKETKEKLDKYRNEADKILQPLSVSLFEYTKENPNSPLPNYLTLSYLDTENKKKEEYVSIRSLKFAQIYSELGVTINNGGNAIKLKQQIIEEDNKKQILLEMDLRNFSQENVLILTFNRLPFDSDSIKNTVYELFIRKGNRIFGRYYEYPMDKEVESIKSDNKLYELSKLDNGNFYTHIHIGLNEDRMERYLPILDQTERILILQKGSVSPERRTKKVLNLRTVEARN